MEIETINGVINVDLTKVTLNDVSGIISNLPVDLDVSVNAKTILYSGSISGQKISSFVKQFEDVRLLDKTAAAKFLSNDANTF